MSQILGYSIISFLVTSILLVPFINFLYKIHFQRQVQKTKDVFESPTPIFDKLHSWKAGTPVGGGALVVLVVIALFAIIFLTRIFWREEITAIYPRFKEISVLLFTFVSFALLGLYDDIIKIFGFQKTKFWGLRFRHKFFLQCFLGLFIASLLYFWLGINIINIPGITTLHVGFLYLPFAAFVIVAFANAFNITDGLDGLSSGLLTIALTAFLVISSSILDTVLSVFIGLWIGALIAFLYFNIYPARIWLGDVGAMAFGATLAIVGLLLGKVIALAVIGGIFIIEVSSSLLQILSKKFRGKKLFEVSPLHLYLQHKGWEEPKIVMRFWLAGTMFALIGLWLALIKG